jgi:hypothetical protein
MEINKNCGTCEFNFGGTCVSKGELRYGDSIEGFDKARSCWSLSFEYFE